MYILVTCVGLLPADSVFLFSFGIENASSRFARCVMVLRYSLAIRDYSLR